MFSKKVLLVVLLSIVALFVGCSSKPSQSEFEKLVLGEFLDTVSYNPWTATSSKKQYCHKEEGNNKVIWCYQHTPGLIVMGGAPMGESTLQEYYYFVGTEIKKNEVEQQVDNYPYIGKMYYIGTEIKDIDIRQEQVRKSILGEVSKLKVEDVNSKERVDKIKINGAKKVWVKDITLAWGKKTKKWQ